ncbi:MAG: HDOD domain-containing protein [Syntrophobacteraceae bacterium]
MIRELSQNEINALQYELLMKDIIAAAEKLPPFPEIAWKLTSLIRKTASVKEMEAVIRLDQALAARLLRLSQAACYGRRYEVRSLQDAILLLGNKRLLQVIISSCASRYFERAGCGRDEKDLWEHSVASALMAELISRRLGNKKILTIYTSSLLHDIGKTILNIYAKIYLHSTLSRIRGEGHFIRAERRALGIDHQELGGMIARNWKFPPEIIAAIEHHHDPEKAGQHREIASIVYMANEMVGSAVREHGDPARSAISPQADSVFRFMGITAADAEELQEELARNLLGVRRMLAG